MSRLHLMSRSAASCPSGRGAAACLAFLLAAAPAARAQSEPIVETKHQVMIDGKPLRYTAQAGRVDIANSETGELRARMFFVAYRVASSTPRPVTFLWNGGPGSATTVLHYDAVAPVILQQGKMVDNPATILRETDLVYVDAVGTGFSRLAKTEFAREFYNTTGDVASFTEFIRAWRLLFDAEDSPVFMVGESFGSARAAGVAAGLLRRRVPVAGIVLLSGSLAVKSTLAPSMAQALRIPELAAISLGHGRGATDLGRDTTVVRAAARKWAVETYAPALERVAALDDAEREAIAKELAHFTGIPLDRIDRKTLVVTPRQYREDLLRDQGKVIPLFDLRRSGPSGGSRGDQRVLQHYLRRTLGYRTSMPYAGLGEDVATGYYAQGLTAPDSAPRGVGARWNYFAPGTSEEERQRQIAEAVRVGGGPPGGQAPWTEEAIALNPKLKVLVASGLYDSGSCSVIAETVRQLPPPVGQAFTVRCYGGGHMMYQDAPARAALSADLKALVAAGMREVAAGAAGGGTR